MLQVFLTKLRDQNHRVDAATGTKTLNPETLSLQPLKPMPRIGNINLRTLYLSVEKDRPTYDEMRRVIR